MSDDLLRDSSGRFAVGNTGGPGRPRSAVSRGAVELDEIGADMGKQLLQVMLDKALAGDTEAAKLLLSRIWPARRGRPVEIESPPIKTLPDYVAAAGEITNAVMRGEMTPHEGRAVSSMLDMQCRAIDMVELERRLYEIEKRSEERAEREKERRTTKSRSPYSTDHRTVFDRIPEGSDDENA